MIIQQNNTKHGQSNDFLTLQELFGLCLAKWYWFVIALAVTLGVAVAYILSTPPVYLRSASLLIKEEGKGQSFSGDVSSTFSDMGLFQVNTNVNNELVSLQSPAVMMDVVKRLHLDVDYAVEGSFYRKVIYGRTLPYIVSFLDLQDSETASLTLLPSDSCRIKLADFTRNGDEVTLSSDGVEGALSDTLSTPLGRVLVQPSFYYDKEFASPVHVSRISLNGAVARYQSALSVSLNDEKTTIINLSLRDVCPQRAEEVLNTLIAVYNENWVKDKNQIAVSTSLFINERLGVIERELGNVDEDISSFKSEHQMPDVEAASSLYMAQSSENNARILALNTQLSMAHYIRNYLSNAGSRNQLLPANSGLESANIEQQITEYNNMQLQRNSLVANSSEQNPLVVDLDRSLQAMRSAIISSVDNLVVTLNTRIHTLQQSEAKTVERITASPTQAKYLLSVERQQKVKEALYLFLLQKREENELSQAFTAYNTRIITPPGGSMLPVAPLKKNILLVALAIGLLVPAVVLFLRETMDTTVRGKKDLEGLSLPFVGEIPEHIHKKSDGDEAAILVKQGKRDVVNEAFRVLRTNLEFMTHTQQSENVMLVTSFNPGSGKTFLTRNLAYSLVLKGKRVLIIDGDLRRASLSLLAGSPRQGLSDYLGGSLSDPDRLIIETPYSPLLHLIPVGTVPPNPTELLGDERLSALLASLRSRYDYIFIDCPPVDIVADTQILNRLADRTLFVVRVGMLKREMLSELEAMYADKRFKGMAVVLNGAVSSHSRYGYRYGYHYGYGSSSYYSSK